MSIEEQVLQRYDCWLCCADNRDEHLKFLQAFETSNDSTLSVIRFLKKQDLLTAKLQVRKPKIEHQSPNLHHSLSLVTLLSLCVVGEDFRLTGTNYFIHDEVKIFSTITGDGGHYYQLSLVTDCSTSAKNDLFLCSKRKHLSESLT